MMLASRELLDVLFASLWQDAIVGFGIATVIYALGRRLNAATRTAILQGALIAMLVIPVATTLPHILPATLTESRQGGAFANAANAAGNATTSFGLRRIDVVLSDRGVLIVSSLWLAGAIVLLLRIALGMAQLSRFVHRSERICDRDGARIYASAAIRVPVTFGMFQPAIVVPADIVRGAADDLECVLLHELAHVRRCDAWSHTFERFVQALLFFNPAIVLLLQSIALEREAACDDWAVAHSHDAAKYTNSLATLAIRTGVGAQMAAACGAIGFGHAIISRIERLEDLRRNGSLVLSRYALGGFALMLVTIALSLQMFAPAIAFSPQTSVPQVAAASRCTQPVTVTFPVAPQESLPAGSATVKVSVSPTGAVTAATIAQSSGNVTFDRAALATAKENGYAPAVRNCKPVAGFYLFKLSNPGVK